MSLVVIYHRIGRIEDEVAAELPAALLSTMWTIDPEAVWIVAEAIITNQHDETVCVIRNTLLTHRTPEEVAASG